MNELEILKKQYIESLPGKVQTINNTIQKFLHALGSKGTIDWKDLENPVHKLSGSSGTYGFGSLSRVSSHLELAILSGQIMKLSRVWAIRYLQTWQSTFVNCVHAIEQGKDATASLNTALGELDHLLRAREVA